MSGETSPNDAYYKGGILIVKIKKICASLLIASMVFSNSVFVFASNVTLPIAQNNVPIEVLVEQERISLGLEQVNDEDVNYSVESAESSLAGRTKLAYGKGTLQITARDYCWGSTETYSGNASWLSVRVDTYSSVGSQDSKSDFRLNSSSAYSTYASNFGSSGRYATGYHEIYYNGELQTASTRVVW